MTICLPVLGINGNTCSIRIGLNFFPNAEFEIPHQQLQLRVSQRPLTPLYQRLKKSSYSTFPRSNSTQRTTNGKFKWWESACRVALDITGYPDQGSPLSDGRDTENFLRLVRREDITRDILARWRERGIARLRCRTVGGNNGG